MLVKTNIMTLEQFVFNQSKKLTFLTNFFREFNPGIETS